jgi:hypothetical protein
VTLVREHRWVKHPAASKIVQGAAVLAPPLIALGAALIVGTVLPRPAGLGVAIWIVAVIATGIAVLRLTGPLGRYSLAVATLLELELVFPGRAPSRLSVINSANRIARLKTQARAATSGNGSATNHVAVSLAVALGRYSERVRYRSSFGRLLDTAIILLATLAIATTVALGPPFTAKLRATGIPHRSTIGTSPPVRAAPITQSPPAVTVEPQASNAGPASRIGMREVRTEQIGLSRTSVQTATGALPTSIPSIPPSPHQLPPTSEPPAGSVSPPLLPVTVPKPSGDAGVAANSTPANSEGHETAPRHIELSRASADGQECALLTCVPTDSGGRQHDDGRTGRGQS